MFVVDTQIHIWKEESPDRPWVPGARERIRLNGHREDPFSYEEAPGADGRGRRQPGPDPAAVLGRGSTVSTTPWRPARRTRTASGSWRASRENKPEEGKAML
ncbi:hypothetical protein ACRAWF_21205 [Streptomyces sp. L7]